MTRRSAVAVLAAAGLLAGCGTSVTLSGPEHTPPAKPTATASTTAEAPTTAPPPTLRAPTTTAARTPPRPPRSPRSSPSAPPPASLDTWEVGASPLPLRPDGFGQVIPTPEELRVRLLATRDLLPPPPDARFHSTVGPISNAVRRRMGRTWSPDCPVRLDELRYVTVSFWGFDRHPHTGELVVHADVAQDVVGVFRRLHATRFPIEEMRLITSADLDAPPTGDGNNTAAYVCRAARGQSSWSAHAYGLAIDVNPFQNPYQRDDLVLPELASAYLDRDWRRPGMIHPGGVVAEAFTGIGWTWGGTFRSLTDSMHFSATGR